MATQTTVDLVLGVLDGMRDWRVASTLWPLEVESTTDSAGDAWHREHTHSHPYREVLIPLAGAGSSTRTV